MKKNLEIVNGIKEMDENKFLNHNECLNYSYGLINEIRKDFMKLNKEILISNEVISKISKEMYILDERLLNSYKGINGYLVYDFLKVEYDLILDELTKMINI